jgi:hypothetical protein
MSLCLFWGAAALIVQFERVIDDDARSSCRYKATLSSKISIVQRR